MITKFADGTIEIFLGNGDVKIMPGKTKDGVTGVAFAQMNATYPVGHRFPGDIGKNTNELGACVNIFFRSETDIINFISLLCAANTGEASEK